MSQPIPEHIKQMIERNPTAVLTSRGIVLPRANGFEELLSGIPNADKLYQKEFDEIRTKQKQNRETAKITTHIETPAPAEPLLKVETAELGKDGLLEGKATVLEGVETDEEQKPATPAEEPKAEVEASTAAAETTQSLEDADVNTAADEAKVAADEAEKAVVEAEVNDAPKEEVKAETAAEKKARERAERKAAKEAEKTPE